MIEGYSVFSLHVFACVGVRSLYSWECFWRGCMVSHDYVCSSLCLFCLSAWNLGIRFRNADSCIVFGPGLIYLSVWSVLSIVNLSKSRLTSCTNVENVWEKLTHWLIVMFAAVALLAYQTADSRYPTQYLLIGWPLFEGKWWRTQLFNVLYGDGEPSLLLVSDIEAYLTSSMFVLRTYILLSTLRFISFSSLWQRLWYSLSTRHCEHNCHDWYRQAAFSFWCFPFTVHELVSILQLFWF
jgi:hypothetical protein